MKKRILGYLGSAVMAVGVTGCGSSHSTNHQGTQAYGLNRPLSSKTLAVVESRSSWAAENANKDADNLYDKTLPADQKTVREQGLEVLVSDLQRVFEENAREGATIPFATQKYGGFTRHMPKGSGTIFSVNPDGKMLMSQNAAYQSDEAAPHIANWTASAYGVPQLDKNWGVKLDAYHVVDVVLSQDPRNQQVAGLYKWDGVFNLFTRDGVRQVSTLDTNVKVDQIGTDLRNSAYNAATFTEALANFAGSGPVGSIVSVITYPFRNPEQDVSITPEMRNFRPTISNVNLIPRVDGSLGAALAAVNTAYDTLESRGVTPNFIGVFPVYDNQGNVASVVVRAAHIPDGKSIQNYVLTQDNERLVTKFNWEANPKSNLTTITNGSPFNFDGGSNTVPDIVKPGPDGPQGR